MTLMLREVARRDRILTILPYGKVGRELVKKRASPCGNQPVREASRNLISTQARRRARLIVLL
jgi:hypothetical protein